MKFVRFSSDGSIHSVNTCADKDITVQPGYPDEIIIISASENVGWDTHYVEDNKLIEKSNKPSVHHKFDYKNKEWYLDEVVLMNLVRMERDAKLIESDWTDTLSAKSRLGDVLYNAWQDYRQALRDLPQNTTDPSNVVWPTPPQS